MKAKWDGKVAYQRMNDIKQLQRLRHLPTGQKQGMSPQGRKRKARKSSRWKTSIRILQVTLFLHVDCKILSTVATERSTYPLQKQTFDRLQKKTSSLKQENGSEVKKATIKSKTKDVFCQPKIEHTAHLISERWQKNVAPQRKRQERSRKTESDGPQASNEQTESRSEQDDFEEVFEFALSQGSRRKKQSAAYPRRPWATIRLGLHMIKERTKAKIWLNYVTPRGN